MGSRARWDLQVLLEMQAYPDLKDPLDVRDQVAAPSLAQLVLLEKKDRRVKPANKDNRVFLEDLDLWEERDLQDPEDLQEKMAHREDRDPRDQWEPREPQDLLELQALQEN